MSVPRPAMLVAIVITPGRPACATISASRRVLLGVEHLVRQLGLLQQPGDQLGVLDRGRADEHRLAALVAVADVLDHRLVLLARGLVDEVELVLADRRPVRRDDHRLEAVDLLELVGLGVGRAGHAGELAVHAEVVLERDRGERLVLALDLHAFLGLDGLVQAVAPAPAGHQAAGELVDDDDLAVLHDVVLVAVVEVLRAQRRVHVVHQRDVGRVVEARALGAAGPARASSCSAFSWPSSVRNTWCVFSSTVKSPGSITPSPVRRSSSPICFFSCGTTALIAHVHLGVVFGLAADDQRRARLVDQDRVDLVDDRVVQAALRRGRPASCTMLSRR